MCRLKAKCKVFLYLTSTCHEEWTYSSRHSQLRFSWRWVVRFISGERAPGTVEVGTGRAPDLLWTLWISQNSVVRAGSRRKFPSSTSQYRLYRQYRQYRMRLVLHLTEKAESSQFPGSCNAVATRVSRRKIRMNLLNANMYYLGKCKAISLQAWTGPEGSRRLRVPDF
jgi:hypothetical protein